MNIRLTACSALLGLTGVVHVTLGGRDVHQPLLEIAASAELALYVTLLWHFVTWFFLVAAVATGIAANRGQNPHAVALLCLGMGGLFLSLGILRLGEPWTAPQWILLIPVGIAMLWPARA